MNFGVYIHYPYCRSRCRYCDFFAMTSPPPQEAYAEAVSREAALRGLDIHGRTVGSIYVGGGTPSLWGPKSVGLALAAVRRHASVADGAEVTLEADPGTVTQDGLLRLRDAGVNRLSIGGQSFDDRTLAMLGRRHSGSEAVDAVEWARKAGFENVSVDLIYGIPGQTVDQVGRDVEIATALSPEHVSAYELMVRDLDLPTAMGRDVSMGRLTLPDEDELALMETAVIDGMGTMGLKRYEVSSFAREGMESRHNRLYWNGDEYLGLGIGAVGFSLNDPDRPWLGGRRWRNHRVPKLYYEAIARGELPEMDSEALSVDTLFQERVQLGLRQCRGVDLKTAMEELAVDETLVKRILERAAGLAEEGLAMVEGWRVALTERGMDLHTEMVLRLLDDRT